MKWNKRGKENEGKNPLVNWYRIEAHKWKRQQKIELRERELGGKGERLDWIWKGDKSEGHVTCYT